MSCNDNSLIIYEAGVTKELAKQRKKNISDINYNLIFTIPDSLNKNITGKVIIKFKVKNINDDLVIDFSADKKSLKSVKINDKHKNYTFKNEHIIVSNKYLIENDNKVEIEFTAGDNALNRNTDYLYSLFVPDRASTVFPCFDQPDLKATYDLKLEIPKKWIAVSNGSVEEINNTVGKKIYKFKRSPLISTYHFAFATGEFRKLTKTKNGRTLSLFHREPNNEKVNINIDDIFDLHFIAIEWMEKYTGIPYPFKKLDFVAVPSFQFSGMEHVDAIFYRSSRLFLSKSASIESKMQRASLITHETSHLWFGDLVTMKWFDDVWLKEVFANFFAEKMIKPFFPEIDQDLVFINKRFPRAYLIDRTEGTTPIIQKLDNLKFAGTLYGKIIYDKAPIIMAKIEQMIGKDSLQESLREYLNTYEYGNANWNDLITILDKKTTLNLAEWSKVWVEKAGMPHISSHYELDKDNKISKFILKQKAYNSNDAVWSQKIEILTSKDGKINRYPVYLDKKELIINEIAGIDKPDYILLNGDGYGYGYFEMDTISLNFLMNNLCEINNSKIKAFSYITLYQAMLNYKLKPKQLINKIVCFLESENENLNIPVLLDYLKQIWWYFLSNKERAILANDIEPRLLNLIKSKNDKESSRLIYKALSSIFITKNLTDKQYNTWKYKKKFQGLKLSKSDYTNLAYELVLREHPKTEDIINEQLSRIKNPDYKKEVEFIFPALSPLQAKRDLFFVSLKKIENRQHEIWVRTALSYLNHPLRAKHSIKYLKTSLEMLEEIQATGDIFFPKNWLANTVGTYNSSEAAQIVRDFIKEHPNYNHNLKSKILQYSDLLFRAEKIVKE